MEMVFLHRSPRTVKQQIRLVPGAAAKLCTFAVEKGLSSAPLGRDEVSLRLTGEDFGDNSNAVVWGTTAPTGRPTDKQLSETMLSLLTGAELIDPTETAELKTVTLEFGHTPDSRTPEGVYPQYHLRLSVEK
jgi:hypothetical protein